MKRLLFAALSLPLTLIGCATETTPPDGDEGAEVVKTKESESEPSVARVPFCLAGEVLVCTLGPPSVCHCSPAAQLPVGK
jgi:hypothetical protein